MNTVIFKCSGILPQMTQFDLDVLRPSIRTKLMSNEQIDIKKSLRMVTRKFQFSKSNFSKYRIILEPEMKTIINFSIPKNPNITYHMIYTILFTRLSKKTMSVFAFSSFQYMH